MDTLRTNNIAATIIGELRTDTAVMVSEMGELHPLRQFSRDEIARVFERAAAPDVTTPLE